ncbi:MAG: AlpA family phage regulatory protein [Alphaproteobacteria bacterium]|nr:AlpA family phage regulatory protein [Alphaproteobacteria bacterium]
MENIENKKERLLTRHDLSLLGIKYSNTHLLFMENLGIFPKRIRLSPQRVVWLESEILTHIDQCKNRRTSHEG